MDATLIMMDLSSMSVHAVVKISHRPGHPSGHLGAETLCGRAPSSWDLWLGEVGDVTCGACQEEMQS